MKLGSFRVLWPETERMFLGDVARVCVAVEMDGGWSRRRKKKKMKGRKKSSRTENQKKQKHCTPVMKAQIMCTYMKLYVVSKSRFKNYAETVNDSLGPRGCSLVVIPSSLTGS